jgi:hypothetical protein
MEYLYTVYIHINIHLYEIFFNFYKWDNYI